MPTSMAGAEGQRPLIRDVLVRAECLVERLHPHRTTLLTAGFGAFALGLLPLAAVVHGFASPAHWHAIAFAMAVPIVLWAIGLVVAVTFFHPTEGLVGTHNREWLSRQPWVQACLRAYAGLTVGAFGVSPVVVLGAAAV